MRQVVITLSSIPPRFARLGPTLASLLAQDQPAAAIQLWIPPSYRRFPDWDGRLPEVPAGVTLCRADRDYGPATKILPAVRQFAGQDVELLFCDDDRIYPPGWLAQFVAVRARQPDAASAARGIHLPGLGRGPRRPDRMPRMRRWAPAERAADPTLPPVRDSGFCDQIEGWAGVMVRPGFFSAGVFEIPPVLWTVDDTWLSGDLERMGIPIWVDRGLLRPRHRPEAGHVHGLLQSVIEGHDRVAAERAAIAWYQQHHGIWQLPPASAVRRLARRLRPNGLRARLLQRLPRLSAWR